jgi:hypothetical protein
MSNQTQQTAVEKFIEKLEELGDLRDCTSIGLIQLNIDKKEYIELKREAKEMEKEQMIKFARYVLCEATPTWDGVTTEFTVEQYYNETYGGNK